MPSIISSMDALSAKVDTSHAGAGKPRLVSQNDFPNLCTNKVTDAVGLVAEATCSMAISWYQKRALSVRHVSGEAHAQPENTGWA